MENKNELIIVKQLPIIEEKLKGLSEEIDRKVENATSLVVSEDTVKEVKQVRADLNKDFKELEEQRKMVKEKVYAPYKAFEDIYKTYVSDKYKNADSILKNKIDTVETQQKQDKEDEVRAYFNELLEKENINFVEYKRANINVTLSASMKSLKEQAKGFVGKIVDDLKLIDTQNNSSEILIEYKKDLNVSRAITEVKTRVEELNRLAGVKEDAKEVETSNNEMLEKVNSLSAPTINTDNEVLELGFKVRATRTKLRELKVFLDAGGYDYD